jgi:hypothetical protein
MIEKDLKIEPEFNFKFKREDLTKVDNVSKLSLEGEIKQEEEKSENSKKKENLKVEQKSMKSRNNKKRVAKPTNSMKNRKEGTKRSKKETSSNLSEEKSLKIINNWVQCWIKINNTIETNESIWIKKWVKLTESDNLSKKKTEIKKNIPKVFKCTDLTCQKIFWDENKLKKHMVVHGEKQFNCEYENCGKSFLDKSKLKRHRLVHTKERHYKCEICGKRFSLDFNLKTHIRTHTGLKPFVCEFPNCNRRFTQSSNLAAHQKIHYKIGGKVRKSRGKKKHTPPTDHDVQNHNSEISLNEQFGTHLENYQHIPNEFPNNIDDPLLNFKPNDILQSKIKENLKGIQKIKLDDNFEKIKNFNHELTQNNISNKNLFDFNSKLPEEVNFNLDQLKYKQ